MALIAYFDAVVTDKLKVMHNFMHGEIRVNDALQ